VISALLKFIPENSIFLTDIVLEKEDLESFKQLLYLINFIIVNDEFDIKVWMDNMKKFSE